MSSTITSFKNAATFGLSKKNLGFHEKKTTSFETSLETFTKLCATLGTDGTHSCRRRLHQASSGVVEGVEVARTLLLAFVSAVSHAGSPF